jgi:hypothetical protein
MKFQSPNVRWQGWPLIELLGPLQIGHGEQHWRAESGAQGNHVRV